MELILALLIVLWLAVEEKRYTISTALHSDIFGLWLAVEEKRYTIQLDEVIIQPSCGLL